jgi:hypothetical protein
MRRVPVLKGDLSTTQQVIFALLFTIFVLGLLIVRLDFSMRGKLQPEILAITASSAVNALSGMEQGSITMNFDRAWDITLTRDSIKFESEGNQGEADVLGSVREAKIPGADKIQITKEMNRPLELIKAE